MIRYEARMVACGNEQVLVRDYTQFFFAVMNMVSVKFVLYVAAVWEVPTHYFDVPSDNVKSKVEEDYDSYLHSIRDCLTLPRKIAALGVQKEQIAIKLQQSLCELKQAGRI